MSINLVFLIDTSLSMKISGRDNMVNQVMPRVLYKMYQKTQKLDLDASVRIIEFNDRPQYMIGSMEEGVDLKTAMRKWRRITPQGATRTGLAIEEAVKVMSNKYLLLSPDNVIYAPVIILFTDGHCSKAWKEEYGNAIEKLKNARRTNSGNEAILRIALGVDEADESELNLFASRWKTVTGSNADGSENLENEKLQVYMIKDVNRIADVLTNLSVSSIQASSTADQEREESAPIRVEEENMDGFETKFDDFN